MAVYNQRFSKTESKHNKPVVFLKNFLVDACEFNRVSIYSDGVNESPKVSSPERKLRKLTESNLRKISDLIRDEEMMQIMNNNNCLQVNEIVRLSSMTFEIKDGKVEVQDSTIERLSTRNSVQKNETPYITKVVLIYTILAIIFFIVVYIIASLN